MITARIAASNPDLFNDDRGKNIVASDVLPRQDSLLSLFYFVSEKPHQVNIVEAPKLTGGHVRTHPDGIICAFTQ